MAGVNLCKGAKVVIDRLCSVRGDKSCEFVSLAQKHHEFIGLLKNLCGTSRDVSVAITNSETAFAWALKALCETYIPDEFNEER